jgi:large subunit ribosomal protein L3
MLNTILGEKVEMSQTFIQGTRVPVTKVKVGPCVVTQVKSQDKDGYWSVQLGYGSRKLKNITKAQQGHLKGAISDKKAPFFMREVKMTEKPEVAVGDKIVASTIFSEGDVIAVSGVTKGKGFAGVVKRWGFAGLPRTHGTAKKGRSPGSIGRGTTPGRVLKGKKMGGRMGGDLTTIKNLTIISVDDELGEVVLSGTIPGSRGTNLIITKIRAGKLSDLEEKTPVAQIQTPQEVDVKVEGAESEKKAESDKKEE